MMIYFFLIGTIIGSFMNVVIIRLPHHEKIGLSRSFCRYCFHPLSPWHMIPLVSYVLLKGKCNYCHHRISFQYFFMELLGGLLALLCFSLWNDFWDALIGFILIELLIVLSWIDSLYMEVSNGLLLALGFVCFLFSFNYPLLWKERIFGMALIPLCLMCLNAFIECFGEADLYCFMFSGYLFGLKNNFYIFFIALMSASIVALILILGKKKTLQSKLPFLPFISIGMLFYLFI